MTSITSLPSPPQPPRLEASVNHPPPDIVTDMIMVMATVTTMVMATVIPGTHLPSSMAKITEIPTVMLTPTIGWRKLCLVIGPVFCSVKGTFTNPATPPGIRTPNPQGQRVG